MTTNEIIAVKDSIMQVLGQGIEKATPLCEEIVKQYKAKCLAMFICELILLTAIVFFISKMIKKVKEDSDFQELVTIVYIIASTSMGIGAIVLVIAFIESLAGYVAPLCGLLGK